MLPEDRTTACCAATTKAAVDKLPSNYLAKIQHGLRSSPLCVNTTTSTNTAATTAKPNSQPQYGHTRLRYPRPTTSNCTTTSKKEAWQCSSLSLHRLNRLFPEQQIDSQYAVPEAHSDSQRHDSMMRTHRLCWTPPPPAS